MTPGARVQAAIGILDRVFAGMPAEKTLTGWARMSRFAGSGDRAAVRDHVFDALRRRRSAAAAGGAETGRGVMLGILRQDGVDPASLFTGQGHAPAPLDAHEAGQGGAAYDPATDTATAWDLPDWLLASWQAALGKNAEAAALALRTRAPVFLRVALRRGGREAACRALAADGVEAIPVSESDTALLVKGGARRIAGSAAYRDGLVELQDLSSQRAVAFIVPGNPLTILDYCAGGGGKALALADLTGRAVSVHDAEPRRMKDIPARAARARADLRAVMVPSGRHDLVVCDAPCSGSGTWRRSPDAKWRLTPDRLGELVAVQDAILDDGGRLVAPGGHLAYMTCSVLTRENMDRIAAFLVRHDGWTLDRDMLILPEAGGGDGFYAALLKRTG